ncbi:MAG: hypothetical protein KJ718_03545 [Nanoarchaeota archaeon]|nr:hypothetical protein [Nanoarchaeota archaeon]MBU1051604.1 hypothetical protein [Nanoarchaeota archaeon]MBU1988040.1 hypothetical protein [Nanoarchaeota archaeon]
MKYVYILAILILIMPVTQAQEEITLSSLTLKEKIAQSVMVKGNKFDDKFTELGVGGVFLDGLESEEAYKELIEKYQDSSKIKLFVATDLEGYWNPFPNYKSKSFGEIKNQEQAYQLGKEHGQILKETGFNLDFSLIAESKNTVWPGRSFIGSNEEIKQKIKFYIKGLQEQRVMAIAKHYPGGSMLKDPHIFKVKANISEQDLELFDIAIKNNVSAIMIGHTIVSGTIDSKTKQSTVSKEVISHLREKQKFKGIVITDAIGMMGLRWSYLFNHEKLYVDLAKAGNDIILDSAFSFSNHGERAEKGINAVVKAVENGEISEKRIDESVKRILEAKGYQVIS